MKRNNQLILCLIISALSMGGCKNFSLEEEPASFLATEQFFKTESDAQAAIYAAYQCFFEPYYYSVWWVGFPDMLSDYINGRGGQAAISNYSLTTTSPYFENTYAVFYKSINRANLVLKYVADIDMDDAMKRQILAEAKFIRALDYYNLVRGWGGVPIRTEPSEGFGGLSVPRSSEDDVFNLIIDDLLSAEIDLPDSYAPSQAGRATKWAAKTLLAEVYLYTEDWSNAASKAKEVIDSRKFSLVEVARSDDFLALWGPDAAATAEEIFTIHFVPEAGSNIPHYTHIAEAGYALPGAYYAWLGDLGSWLKDWDENDLRRNYNMYNGSDLQWLSVSVPMLFKKYRNPQATGPDRYTCNVIPLRYADALLIFAEAQSQANQGPDALAYDAVNQIRRRAYGVDLTQPNPTVDLPVGMGAQAFREAILQERAYEFCVEGKRWWDLKRSGTAKSVIAALGKSLPDRYLMFPIPLTEIQNNEWINQSDQNPGWE